MPPRRQPSRAPGVIVDDEADEVLVERYRHGDRDAFAALVVRYQRPVFNAAWWVVKNADDAADIAQSVFLKVAERIDDFDPQYRFFSWLYRIAVNEALNSVRRHGREEPLDDEVDVPGPDGNAPDRRLEDARLSARLREAMARLSTNDRTVLVLRHFSELSYQEIGQVLELDEKTVKSRLHEARMRLRGMLGDLRDDPR
ncbi:MAG: sigma-70 family RNA polymerase sigma factor [Betaproteobacteria bacterium PRO3]|nr:sigma-70 family RNA polymerase sigma factor [Betaproteobacteria bacterium PRO3]